MDNSAATEANPFRKIEITILIVFIVWIVSILGWFVNSRQISPQDKLVSNAELFLKENTVKVETLDCVVEQNEESGRCKVTTTNQKKIVVQCPIQSMISEFAKVFFAKGEPCVFLDPQ